MRKTYLDNIRWITVVIVVFYHVIYMFNGVTTYAVLGPFYEKQPQDLLLYVVYPWLMLLLFVVSGMAARFELEHCTTKEFILKRTRKLLVPSTIGLVIWGWVLGYYNILVSGSLEQMSAVPKPIFYLILCISGTGPLWYIQTLWLFSLLLLLIRKIERDKLWKVCRKAGVIVALALTVVIFGASQILNVPVVEVYRFGIYGAGFMIGYFVFSHDEVMEKIGRKWVLLSILAVVSGVTFVFVYRGKSCVNHEVLDTILCNVYAWLGTLGILAFMHKWGDFENGFTGWMKTWSFGLYVFHYLPILMCGWYLKTYATGLAPVLIYMFSGLVGFAGAYALYFIFSKIPVLRWCILGIRKKGKNELCR